MYLTNAIQLVLFDKCYTKGRYVTSAIQGARRTPGDLSGVGQIIQSKFAEPGNYMGALAMRQCVLIDEVCELSQGSKYKT